MAKELSLEVRLLKQSEGTFENMTSKLLEKLDILSTQHKTTISKTEIEEVNRLSMLSSIAEHRYNLAYTYVFLNPSPYATEVIKEINKCSTMGENVYKNLEKANKLIKETREALKIQTGKYLLQDTTEWSSQLYQVSLATAIKEKKRVKRKLSTEELYNIKIQALIKELRFPKIDFKERAYKKTTPLLQDNICMYG
ncbi:MAG: hypothetical protein JSW73_04995 [Candidatus Woesearchaeota archaeon]|nr:MAG: hypothetical protein JSW73_04995 [Candidatus Woesearchaeota archaeon]